MGRWLLAVIKALLAVIEALLAVIKSATSCDRSVTGAGGHTQTVNFLGCCAGAKTCHFNKYRECSRVVVFCCSTVCCKTS